MLQTKLEKLTKEQEMLCDQIVEEYSRDLTLPTPPDGEAITRWLDIVYGLYNSKRPERVEIVESLQRALVLATELTHEIQTTIDYCGIGEGGWIAFYDYFQRIGVIKHDEVADLMALRDFTRCAWDSILFDDCAIVIQRPIALHLDTAGNLHCVTGPCIEWADGEKDYAWHGTWVDERVIMDPKSYTRQEYLAITNTEQRRALSECGGWTWVAELLGTAEVDKWIDPHTSLSYTLLKCHDGQVLLAKQSPVLKDGSQPNYMEPVHENLCTARAARKWQAVPTLTPAECENDPELFYEIEA